MIPCFRSPKILDQTRWVRVVNHASVKLLKASLVLRALIALIILYIAAKDNFAAGSDLHTTFKYLRVILTLTLAPAITTIAALIFAAPLAYAVMLIGWAGSWVTIGCAILIVVIFSLFVPILPQFAALIPWLIGDLFGLYFWLAARRLDPTALELMPNDSDEATLTAPPHY